MEWGLVLGGITLFELTRVGGVCGMTNVLLVKTTFDPSGITGVGRDGDVAPGDAGG